MKQTNKNTALLQFTAGRGPAECCWVVAKVVKAFISELKEKGFHHEIVSHTPGPENGTVQSTTIKIIGDQNSDFLKTWIGTIQWIGTSKFRKHHRRKNWFIGVYSLDTLSEEKINPNEFKFQAMRSTGPGGQNVNKVNSAVRATHLPSGVCVVVMDSRSQHQNKKLAIERLTIKLKEAHWENVKKHIEDQWENHLQLSRGNPTRIFRGTDFKQKKKAETHKTKRQKVKNDLKKKQWD